MADIFLSYKREERERARQLVNALEARGWDVFWDSELVTGDIYRQVLAKELANARCVIVLWSKLSIESEWVADEATRGHKRGVLIQALLDKVDAPLGFGQMHLADLSDWPGEAGDAQFELLIHGVLRLIPSVAARPPQPPPTPPPTPEIARPEQDSASAAQRSRSDQSAPAPALVLVAKTERNSWFQHPTIAPTALLLLLFVTNGVQTAVDSALTPESLGQQEGYPIAAAFRWFENYLSFASHDATNAVAYKGYSISYFVLFPLVVFAVALALALRRDRTAYRTFCLAVAIDYLISLPFFIFFPIPERWAYSDTEAMLLCDKWSDKLIEAIRPMSGIDNCFPSFHVSLTVLVITASIVFGVRMRSVVIPLGVTIVLATFVLGIHWLPDMIAGTALGVLSVLWAARLERSGAANFLWDWPSSLFAAGTQS